MSANGIGIVAEEVSDIPRDIALKSGVELVPVGMVWPELEDIPGSNTFQKMRELDRRGTVSFGKTSQPSPEEYAIRFHRQLEKFEEVLCICVSSKLSGCFNSATLARKFLTKGEQGRVQVIDSLNATGGHALVILKAVELAGEGKSASGVVDNLNSFLPRVRMFAMLDDPKWVEAHGRLPHAAGSIIRALSRIGVRPVLEIKHGSLTPSGLKTRAQDKAVALFRQVRATVGKDGSQKHRAAITHGDDEETASRLCSRVKAELKQVDVVFTHRMNDIIGVPAGPDCLAVAISPD